MPTVKLIAPDRTILKMVNTDINAIESMLISEGIQKGSCSNEVIISDTTDPGNNAINSNSWYAATDNEGVGSKVIKEATFENGIINTKMHVGSFSYPNGPWTSGKLAGNIGYKITDYDYVKVTYKSSIDLIFELPIASLDSEGKNFGKRIDECNNFNTLILDLKTFEKPTWAVSDPAPLDKSKVSTISFRTLLADGEDVEISVKEVIFYKKTGTANFNTLKDKNPGLDFEVQQINNNLIINGNYNSLFSYEIISTSGKKLVTGQSKSSFQKIDNLNLSTGVYLLYIKAGNYKQSVTRRFRWTK